MSMEPAAYVDDGRQTPNPQRRPSYRMFSPFKRRRHSILDETPGNMIKSRVSLPREELPWEFVFAFLGARDIIDRVAPVCLHWRQVAHSQQLWATLRRHLRLVDQLLVEEKLAERRSKGRFYKCRRLGTGEPVLLRVVDLELVNAATDDGMPTSFLREAALLARLQHPNIVKHFGAELLGRQAATCTEFVFESFAHWLPRLPAAPREERLRDIRDKFAQLLAGLSYAHHHGVMHRNLKPDNLFIAADGLVKLGDFTTARMLDLPLQAYTPEDPKERNRSSRESRRLWYRAPELILRDDIYGPKVDTWSVGCLLAEAATGQALFESESEIDHLFRVFRLLGTPTADGLLDVIATKKFSPKFPVYSAFSFAQVARAACSDSASDKSTLLRQAQSERAGVLSHLLSAAAVLGSHGMRLLENLVALHPAARWCVDEALNSAFFAQRPPSGEEMHLQEWLLGGTAGLAVPATLSRTAARAGADSPALRRAIVQRHAHEAASAEAETHPLLPELPTLLPARMAWSILSAMVRRECRDGAPRSAKASAGSPLRHLGLDLDVDRRAWLVDFMVGVANSKGLSANTLHLSVKVLDGYPTLHANMACETHLQLIGTTCLKVCDVFSEQSREYYIQETASGYASATKHRVSAEEVLRCEKDLLPRLSFNLDLPTVHWFLQCYLAYGRFAARGRVARVACFFADLCLLDNELQSYRASLVAQCLVVLAACVALQAAPDTVPEQAVHQQDPGDVRCLQHWYDEVRSYVCRGNCAVSTEMCMQALVHMIVEKRRGWKLAKIEAVERKHQDTARIVVYPPLFPLKKLVRYVLPGALPSKAVLDDGQHRETQASKH